MIGILKMLSTIEKALFLKSVNLFEAMSPEQLKILPNISEEVTYETGDILFNEGDPAEHLYIIVDGEINILKSHGTPEEVRLAILGEKTSFGEIALFGSEGRSATAIANRDSTFLSMEKEHLHLLIQENPAISTAIVFQLANLIRDNNKQQSRFEKTEEFDKVAAGDSVENMRQYFRYAVPGVVDVPALSNDMASLHNVSAGGLLLSLTNEPKPEDEFGVSIKINDKVYNWEKVSIVWASKGDNEEFPWTVGLKVNIPQDEQDKLSSSLKDMVN